MTKPSIDRIECFQVRWPMPEPLANSISVFRERTALLVSVSAGGKTGWGETWAQPVAAETIIARSLAPAVLGADPSSPRAIWETLSRLVGRDRSGITHMAISALDMAVWDLSARLENMSLARRLGGPVQTRLPTYASGPFLKTGDDPYRDILHEIEGYLARGFKSVKLRLGANLRSDIRILEQIRLQFGDTLPVMADFNQGLTRLEADRILAELPGFGVLFAEEPLQADDIEGYASLARKSPTAIAAGESLAGVRRFKDLISAGALDVVQPDVALCGGVTEYLRIAALGEAHGLPVIPHVWSTSVIHSTSLQLAAISPAGRNYDLEMPAFEIDPTPNALMEIGGLAAVNADGTIDVPDAPGIGLDLDIETLAPFTQSHTTLSA
ncbi:mandelate racemase/muconate lactonizing protein (plasmid) [Rhizobium phaseoli]|uniref:mandelate racemase/muconate lactonizing enzyme family protein n=1 Tax=Rhizobium phaseoli TaxID=396 RepID=UPI0007F15AA9|nr:mandelate racemase/muconate lactonizing enzyme family protein [Rhizobium phaseoli]ANL51040.1 mandelate racemase/muconate lactonizing protein [Rhizobium phaseoli]